MVGFVVVVSLPLSACIDLWAEGVGNQNMGRVKLHLSITEGFQNPSKAIPARIQATERARFKAWQPQQREGELRCAAIFMQPL